MSSHPNVPIVNAGVTYVNGCYSIADGGSKSCRVSAGASRDSSNVADIILQSPVVISGLVVGAGGVDLAVVAANNLYAAYVIADSKGYKPSSAILSLQLVGNVGPVLPTGYDMWRRVGYVYSDSSANFAKWYVYGAGEFRSYYFDVPVSILSGSAATGYTAIYLDAMPGFNLSAFTLAYLNVKYSPSAPSNFISFLSGNSSASASASSIFGCAGPIGVVQNGNVYVPCSPTSPSNFSGFQYKASAGDTLALLLAGFSDSLSLT